MFLLVPAHPGSPGQKAVKRLCVCVCVLSVLYFAPAVSALQPIKCRKFPMFGTPISADIPIRRRINWLQPVGVTDSL